jgi:hypothetical protein
MSASHLGCSGWSRFAVLEAVDRPLNVLVWQNVPPVSELDALVGVAIVHPIDGRPR